MAAKIYTKEIILKAAFDLALEVGVDKISMRNLANKIGCSVMPIYEEFTSKEELINAISVFTEQQIDKKSITMYDRFYDLLYYGLKYPKFFLSIVEYDSTHRQPQEIICKVCNLMRRDSRLKDFEEREAYIINTRIEMFIIGIIYTYQFIESDLMKRYPELKRILTETIDSIIYGYLSIKKLN